MFKRTLIVVILGMGLAAGAYTVAASDKGLNDHNACKADVDQFCANVTKEHHGVAKCLDEHMTELSAGCQDAINDMKAIKSACQTDKQNFCPNAKRGNGDVRDCLKSHEAELSTACKDAITAAKSNE